MKDNIVKADYEMVFSLDEIVAMADDNVSYGGGRFAKKWLDEIENNSTDFVHFIAQAIDEYDKSVDIDKQIAITDDDMNTMYAWRESNWVFDGVLENYPKMTRDEEGKIPYTVKGDSVIVKMSVGIDVDMLKYSLENARTDRMIKNEGKGFVEIVLGKDNFNKLIECQEKMSSVNTYEDLLKFEKEYLPEGYEVGAVVDVVINGKRETINDRFTQEVAPNTPVVLFTVPFFDSTENCHIAWATIDKEKESFDFETINNQGDTLKEFSVSGKDLENKDLEKMLKEEFMLSDEVKEIIKKENMLCFSKKDVNVEQNKTTQKGKEQ